MLDDAKELAKSRNEIDVGTEHLLLAMYRSTDTICHFLLSEKNISYTDLENALDKSIILRKVEGIEPRFTKKLQDIVIKAKELAVELKSDYVFDEHIFYTLLLDSSNVAKEMLISLNLDIDEMLNDIEDIFNFTKEDETFLYPFLFNLTKQPRTHPFIKRGNHLERIKTILNKKQKNNPMLIGSAGVGKTALVEGLAEELTDQTIYRLDLGTIMAGTKYRGELEEKLLQAMNFIKEEGAILFIDEIHNIVGAGSNDGSLDLANILKPFLSRADIKCIGATTLDEYYRFIDKDKALKRRFQNIYIDEPTKEETLEILKKIKGSYEEYHNVTFSASDIVKIVEDCEKYLPAKSFPDKAIDVMDEVGARLHTTSEKTISKLIQEVIFTYSGIKVLTCQEIKEMKLNYTEIKPFIVKFFMAKALTLNNIMVIKVDSDFNTEPLLQDFYTIFNLKKEAYLEIDGSMLTTDASINSLIGSIKGYIGYDAGGTLSEHLIKYPFSVVYFKNLDKANSSVINFIQKIMKESEFTDNKGRTIYLRNVIFVYSTSAREKSNKIGFITDKKNSLDEYSYDIKLESIKSVEAENEQEILNEVLQNAGYTIKTAITNWDYKKFENLVYKLILEEKGTYLVLEENEEYIYKIIK